MAKVTGLTAARMLEIEAASIVDGEIDETSGHLILKRHDDTEIDAGSALPALPIASATIKGIVELATAAETLARTDSTRAVTPAGLTSTIDYIDDELDVVDTALTNHASRLTSLETAPPPDPATLGMVGEIRMWAGDTAPTGWRLCDGSTLNRTTFATLYGIIGTKYGIGNGTTTYNIPNLKGRVPVGLDAAQGEFNAVGISGGSKTHTLTTGEMPSHTHTQNSHTHVMQGNGALTDGASGTNYGLPNGSFYGFRTDQPDSTVAVNQNTGGGGAHNNIQPYLTVNYIIKT